MENKMSQQQNMEHLIQKYKEEAMKYRQRYSDLYPEQIPATEVSADPFSTPPEEKANDANISLPTETPMENPTTDKNIETEQMPNIMPEQEDTSLPETTTPDDLPGISGDTSYARTPEEVKDIISKSPSAADNIEYTDTGCLQVQVSTANEAIPIESAIVLVLRKVKNATNLIWNLQTDTSGNTERVELPAPPAILSEQPEPTTVIPYGGYLVIASHPDYYTTIVNDVQIFAGQTALLPVSFIPLAEKDVNPSAPNNEFDTKKHSLLE